MRIYSLQHKMQRLCLALLASIILETGPIYLQI